MREVVSETARHKLDSFKKSPLFKAHIMEKCDISQKDLLKLSQLKSAYNEARAAVMNKLPPGVHLDEGANAAHSISVSFWGEMPEIVKALEPYKEIQQERITFNEKVESFRTSKEALDWAKEHEPDVYRETLARL
jgi:hypothetical protein